MSLCFRVATSYGKLAPIRNGNLCHICILLYMVTTLILIMHDVGHLLGTGIMLRPMGVPLVIAISVNLRGTTEIMRLRHHAGLRARLLNL